MSEGGPTRWTPDRLGDVAGRTMLITGANSGIGWEAARLLAEHGAHVVVAARSEAKAEDAITRIREGAPSASLSSAVIDLADLSSVRAAGAGVRESYPRLDALVNNAGVMALPYRETADGFEMQIGTNHLGHFALTAELLPLVEAAGGRVVTVSSTAARRGRMDLDDLMGERSYGKWSAYARTKLANLLFTLELERRLRAAGAAAMAVACHPGWSATNLQAAGPRMEGSRLKELIVGAANALFSQSAERGAWPTVFAAAAEEVEPGGYYGPDGIGEMRGKVGPADFPEAALDEETARELWQLSESLTGAEWSFGPSPD
jgi:NAD(P)-dependent dehydrogenase (short-subunit alcohol dehydrogenase family)